MSEQFLRVPVAMAQALLTAEHRYPGIGSRVLGAWLRLMHMTPSTLDHSAGFAADEMALLASLGVVVDGLFPAILEHQRRLQIHLDQRREAGRLGGLARAERKASETLARASKTKRRPSERVATASERVATASERVAKTNPETETETETESISSVGSFGACAPTEPPSLVFVEKLDTPEPNRFNNWQATVAALCDAFLAERGVKYTPDGKSMKALKKLEELAKGDSAEVVRRWRIALRSTHPTVGEWGQLLSRWNLFASGGKKDGRLDPFPSAESEAEALEALRRELAGVK